MDNLSFNNRLQLFGSGLSKSERRIAAYITGHPEAAATVSSSELVSAIDTSNSTLTRFCQKLGYRNYIEFQTLLAAENAPLRAPEPIIKKVSSYYEDVLKASEELVTSSDIDNFTGLCRSAGRIFIFGLGSSGLTATELNTRLLQMGFTSNVMTDSLLMQAQSGLFSQSDLVIAISNSGQTSEVIRACSIAKSVGARICVLTQNNTTELVKLADTVLYAGDIRQIGDPLFINSQMPLMFLVDVISYRLLQDDTCRENRRKSLRSLYGKT